MTAKRIPQLDAITGASTANDDNLVIFDTSTNTTKRILRSQLAAGLVSDLPYAASSGSSLVGYLPAGTGAVGTTVQAKLRETVSVLDFGADPTGVADSTTAIQLAVNHLNTVSATQPCTLVFPSGTYLVSNEIDFTATGGQRRHVIGGDGFETARIRVNFGGYNKYVFKFGSPTIPESAERAIYLEGFFFERVNTSVASPVMLGLNSIAQSRIANISSGSWDNTLVQNFASQNCRFENFTCYGGGHSWEYKWAGTTTVQQNGTTLTASASLFSVSDVGHTVVLEGPSFIRKTKIVGFTNATTVTVNTSYVDVVNYKIYFGSALVSINSGSTTLTADAACFSASDVGIVIYVKGARTGNRLHRATIAAYISATQVTLSDAATETVTNVEFATPAFDIHSFGISAASGGSDNTYRAVQIETHRGVAMVLENQDQLAISDTKLHAIQTNIGAGGVFSIAPMWMDGASGYFLGSFDARPIGEEKIFATALTSAFVFQSVTVRSMLDDILLRVGPKAATFEGGLVVFDNVNMLSLGASTTSYKSLVIDENVAEPGYVFAGKFSNNQTDRVAVYNGNRLYADSFGETFFEDTGGTMPLLRLGDRGTGPTGGALTPADITWNGTPPSGTTNLRYRWQRIGNMVFFDFMLNYTVAGTSNSSLVILLPTDMPAPLFSTGAGTDDLAFAFRGGLSTGSTAAYSLTKTWLKNSTPRIEIGMVLNSGTISAAYAIGTGTYWTA